jgi:hypothetical protein
MNDGHWVTDVPTYGISCPYSTYGIYYDTVTTHNGAPTFRQDPSSTGSWGVDWSTGLNVKPGDHIVMSCWIKTAGSNAGLAWGGAHIGFDLRTQDSYGLEMVCAVNSLWSASAGGNPNGVGGDASCSHNLDADSWVNYGQGWTQLVWSFVVPAYYKCDGIYSLTNHPLVTGQNYVPTEIAPWVQVWDSSGKVSYSAWFSDYQLYLNP